MRVIISCVFLLIALLSEAQPGKIELFAGDDERVLIKNGITLRGEIKPNGKYVFAWRQTGGPADASIADSSRLRTKVKVPQTGTYEFELTAFIRQDIVGRDRVSILVYDEADNKLPVADAGGNQSISVGQEQIHVTGKGTDPDGKIAEVKWRQVSGKSIAFEQKRYDLYVSRYTAGDFAFELYVQDDRGGEDRDTVTIRITNPKENKLPIVDAGEAQTITLPDNSVTVKGTADDPDGKIASVAWSRDSGPMRFAIESPLASSTVISSLVEGTYVFNFTATDDRGASSTSQVTILVKPAPPPPPVNRIPIVDAGEDQLIQLPLDSAILSGSARDPEGGNLTVRWRQLPGLQDARIVNATRLSSKIKGLIAGDYQFVLQVTDRAGGIATDTVQVRVLPRKKLLPTISAGPDIVVNDDQNITPLAPVLDDPDTLITKVVWNKLSGASAARINDLFRIESLRDSLINDDYEFELQVETADTIFRDTVSIKVDFPIIVDNGGNGGDDEPKSDLGLILLIVTGMLGAAGAGYRLLFWMPPAKKAVVYFMNKSEELLVDSIIPGGDKTANYSVRHCSRKEIRKLLDNGIAVHMLNTNDLVINTHGRIQQYKFNKKEGFKKNPNASDPRRAPENTMVNLVTESAVKSTANRFPDFYIITLDGPFLPAFQTQVKGLGIEIVQAVPVNSFILYIRNAQQLAALREKPFQFIRLVQPYTANDTGIIVRKENFQQAASAAGSLTLDLLLHRESDLPAVIQFLEQLAIRIIKSHRSRVRIQVDAASITDFQLPENKFIQAISEYIPPKPCNDIARFLIGVDQEVSGSLTVSETGDGEIIAVADTGIDSAHTDFAGRLLEAVSWGREDTNDTSDPNGHGTHVAGSIVGSGAASAGKIKGVAPGAKLFFQSLIDHQGGLGGLDLRLKEIFQQAYDKGARVHNNSWGSTTEARYTNESIEVDEFVYENPEMLIVFAAGNDGMYNDNAESYRGYVGFGSIGSPATSKNGLAVGASKNKRTEGGIADKTYGSVWESKFPYPPTSTELVSGDPESIAAFSSRGRVDDFRMKPDIVAPGTDILSARSGLAPADNYDGEYSMYNNAYAYMCGTSMAAPLVAGAALLVREYYRKTRGCARPSAALVKATLINGTRKLTGASAIHLSDMLPNPNQGYGMLDLSHTIPSAQHPFLLHFHDSLTDKSANLYANEEGFLSNVKLSAASWIRICLAYTDEPGRGIQSDLDLMVAHQETNKKWSGNRGINGHDPMRNSDDDKMNNMEIIRLDSAEPGLYTVKVTAYNLLSEKQGFALVITTGDMGAQFL